MQVPFITSLALKAVSLAKSLERSPVIGGVIIGAATGPEYIRFLQSTYHYVSWSGRLLGMTANGMRRRGRYPSLVELLTQKALEEAPHDRWALRDAEQCGASAGHLRESEPGLAINAYVSWGRALASVGSPAYLGAAYVLEGISLRLAGDAARRLRERASIPGIERAVSFLEGHGDADIAHVATLEQALLQVDDATDQAAILTSADVLCVLYPQFFEAPQGAQ